MKGPLYRHDGRTFHPGLVCDVESVTYDYAQRVGVIHVRDGDCTDMAGAIALLTRLDPQVQVIETYSGALLDTVYVRDRGDTRTWPLGDWQAIQPAELEPSATPEFDDD